MYGNIKICSSPLIPPELFAQAVDLSESTAFFISSTPNFGSHLKDQLRLKANNVRIEVDESIKQNPLLRETPSPRHCQIGDTPFAAAVFNLRRPAKKHRY